jgi:hypothetical protein
MLIGKQHRTTFEWRSVASLDMLSAKRSEVAQEETGERERGRFICCLLELGVKN